ncbi:MAG: PhzF family phenazine biosynthesis protein [Chthoniobacterales bacterium]
MKLPIYQVDAFADQPFEGNPAAVCPLECWLPDSVLQSIAEENNLSETAFFIGAGDRYHLRWFTPIQEVDLCGHATLAAAHVLFSGECESADQLSFDSRSGPLRVFRDGDLLTLDFPTDPGIRCESPVDLIEGLRATPVECYRAMDYLAVFDSEAKIAEISPDFQRLKALDRRGVIVTARGEEEDFVSRFFAPKFGIDEDPVTGSAHCTLAPYWARTLGKNALSAKQISKRTGLLKCRLSADRVFISGRVADYLQGQIEIPDVHF